MTKDSLLKNYASIFLEQPNQVGRYYKDLIPLIGKEIFAPGHEIHSYFTAAYIAYRLEFLFRNRRLGAEWKPFRFQLGMAARLTIECHSNLDSKRKRTQHYCSAIDDVMADPELALSIFESSSKSILEAITALKQQGAQLDRRTAKMRDMKDALRLTILGSAAE